MTRLIKHLDSKPNSKPSPKNSKLAMQSPQAPRLTTYHGPTAAITKPRTKRWGRISTILTKAPTTSPLLSEVEVAAQSLMTMYHHDLSDEVVEVKEADEKYYKCDKCPKKFATYQALGGHHANHNKNDVASSKLVTLIDDDDEDYKGKAEEKDDDDDEVVILGSTINKNVVTGRGGSGSGGACNTRKTKKKRKREFKCPFCIRVFRSGQALGGHKKVHFSDHKLSNSTTPAAMATEPTTVVRNSEIDLNFSTSVDE